VTYLKNVTLKQLVTICFYYWMLNVTTTTAITFSQQILRALTLFRSETTSGNLGK